MTATVAAAFDESVNSPQLPEHVTHLENMLAGKRERRQKFYEEVDESTKAEFINGKIVMHSPARLEHVDVSYCVATLLRQHAVRRGLGKVLLEKAMVRCTRNDYEPDVSFFGSEKAGKLVPGQNLFPPPDLIIEVLSPSTARNDRRVKFQDYAHHGVAEYWIIDADARVVEQYVLAPGARDYVLDARIGENDRLKSGVVTGFDVPAAAIFDDRENQRVLLTLLQG